MQDTVYPHVIISARYDDRLMVHEKIILSEPYTELVLRKPRNLSYLEVKNSQRIVDERESIHVFLKEKRKEIELQYAVDVKDSLFLEWITAPKECYTLDATIITPLPLKSIINAAMYGFHAWGKHGYSRWINSSPRRNYVLAVDDYLIVDNRNYLIASPNENLLNKLRILVNSVYFRSKDIIPWNRPVIVHNNKIASRVSTNIVFIRELSSSNILTLLIQSLVNDLENIPKIDDLSNAINSLINSKIDYKRIIENPYVGLAKLYGEKIIRILLEKTLLTCPNSIEQLIKTVFGDPLSSAILSLLHRSKCRITLYDNKIRCDRGPCIIILEREGVEFLKTILMEGDELVLNANTVNKIKVHVF